MIVPILRHPHAQLRAVCKEVREVGDEVRRLASDMAQTMAAANGIGLAAPQVGRGERLIVVDVSENGSGLLCLANPRIVEREGEIALEEGCLSVRRVQALVPRARNVVVTGLNMDGNEVRVHASDLQAVCLQHEIDHLDGVLFFDHLSRFKRARLLDKYAKMPPDPPGWPVQAAKADEGGEAGKDAGR